MKNIFIILILFPLIISCSKTEPIIASLDKQSILVFNESLVSNPITMDDGFFIFSRKENQILASKIGFDGSRVWQHDITEQFNFSPRVQFVDIKVHKTDNLQIVLAISHIDSIKHNTLNHFVKYMKFGSLGNVLYNFDRPIINGANGSEIQSDKYNYFDTYEASNGDVVSFSSKYESVTAEHILGNLQITRYSAQGDLISNTEIELDNVYEFWEILSFSDNEIKLLAETYGDINVEGYSSIFKLSETDGLLSEIEIPFEGFPVFTTPYNGNFILFYNGLASNMNRLIEIDLDGNVINQQQVNSNGQQFYCVSSYVAGNEIYFAGLSTSNPSELIKPSFTWAKYSSAEFSFLGEFRTMEDAIATNIYKNTDGSLSILGEKESFSTENVILVKTQTDGTIVSE